MWNEIYSSIRWINDGSLTITGRSIMATNIYPANMEPAGAKIHNDPYCELCEETNGENIRVFSYCRECNQFLCNVCNVFHSKLQGTKNHKADTGSDMPGSMAEKTTRFDMCPHHSKERKDQFCFKHKLLLCLSCAKSEHSQCVFMPVFKACQNVSPTQLGYLCNTLGALETNLKSVLSELSANKEILEEHKKKSMEKAKTIYEQLKAKADKIFHEMNAKIAEKYQSNEAVICQQEEIIRILNNNVYNSLNGLQKLKDERMDSKTFLKIQEIVSKTIGYMHFINDISHALIGQTEILLSPNQRIDRYLSPSYPVAFVLERKSKPNVTITVPQISFPILAKRHVTPIANETGETRTKPESGL